MEGETPNTNLSLTEFWRSAGLFREEDLNINANLDIAPGQTPVQVNVEAYTNNGSPITTISLKQGKATIGFEVEERHGLIVIRPSAFTRDENGELLNGTTLKAGEILNTLFQITEEEFNGLTIQVEARWHRENEDKYRGTNWAQLMSILDKETINAINSGDITPDLQAAIADKINNTQQKVNFTTDLLKPRGYRAKKETIRLDTDSETGEKILMLVFQKEETSDAEN